VAAAHIIPIGPDGLPLLIAVLDFDGDLEQAAMLAAVRRRMRDAGVVAWLQFSEIWMNPSATPLRARDDPRRQERVQIVAVDAQHRRYRHLAMQRDYKGRVVALAHDPDMVVIDNRIGHMWNLLD
jgi:hypothetical protein